MSDERAPATSEAAGAGPLRAVEREASDPSIARTEFGPELGLVYGLGRPFSYCRAHVELGSWDDTVLPHWYEVVLPSTAGLGPGAGVSVELLRSGSWGVTVEYTTADGAISAELAEDLAAGLVAAAELARQLNTHGE